MRHLVIMAHPDDELVFMSPAMLDILRGSAPVRMIYLTAGDAGRGRAYARAREAAIKRVHLELRHAEISGTSAVDWRFLRLPDGMLQGQGSSGGRGESLAKLWRGDIDMMHALEGGSGWSRDGLIARLHEEMAAFDPTLVHTLNGLVIDPREHADHHATGRFAAAACARLSAPVAVRFYVGSNSPDMPANVSGAQLADKTAAFASYARDDAEIFNGRDDWLSASIYAPMLERQYYTECNSRDPRVLAAGCLPQG